MIRIFVIEDDEQIIIPGLKSMFRPSRDEIDFIGSAASVEKAIEMAGALKFDIFFLDLYLRKDDPVENIKRLKAHFPTKPIIIYTTEESAVWKRKAFIAGAKGFLTKKDDKQTIKFTITRVAAGHSVFIGIQDEEEEKKFILTLQEETLAITEKEKHLVVLLSNGFKHQEIANSLNISISNVDKLLTGLKKKFNAKNNLSLIKKLSDQALI
jgi:two-component system response regulator FimZ (fimbrial Z protein)